MVLHVYFLKVHEMKFAQYGEVNRGVEHRDTMYHKM
jgi:hypothetical protein